MKICPCKGCEKAGCGSYHDECEKFQAWKAEKEKIIQARAKENAKYNDPKRPQRFKRLVGRR